MFSSIATGWHGDHKTAVPLLGFLHWRLCDLSDVITLVLFRNRNEILNSDNNLNTCRHLLRGQGSTISLKCLSKIQ
jgi:hypothetical protein